LATAALQDSVADDVFSPQAAEAIARASGGVPRLINVLAHKCLMLAYGEGEHAVSLAHVALAIADTSGLKQPGSWWQRLRAAWLRRPGVLRDAKGGVV
jgi:MSHA biogenesis protein MshM